MSDSRVSLQLASRQGGAQARAHQAREGIARTEQTTPRRARAPSRRGLATAGDSSPRQYRHVDQGLRHHPAAAIPLADRSEERTTTMRCSSLDPYCRRRYKSTRSRFSYLLCTLQHLRDVLVARDRNYHLSTREQRTSRVFRAFRARFRSRRSSAGSPKTDALLASVCRSETSSS